MNLFEAPNQLSMIQQFLAAPGSGTATSGPCDQGWQGDSGWSAGNFYSLVTKKKAAKCNTIVSKAAGPVAMSNRFKALAGKKCVEKGPRAPTQTFNILEFAKPAAKQGIIKHSKKDRVLANKNKKTVAFSDKLPEDIRARRPAVARGGRRADQLAGSHIGVPGACAVPADEAGHAETPEAMHPVTLNACQNDQGECGSCGELSSAGPQVDITNLAKNDVKVVEDKNK